MKDEITEQFSIKTYIDKTIYDPNPLAALKYKAKFIPHMLYKYMSFPNNIDKRQERINGMRNGLIWLSKRRVLNDPLEFLRILHYSANCLETREYVTSVINNRVVFCLAQENDNKLMWAHYADAHKGYCIEYKVINSYSIFPIEYTDYFPDYVELLQKVNQSKDSLKNGNATRDERNCAIALSAAISCYKDSCWKYENEYRIHDAHFIVSDDGAPYKATDLGIRMNKIICGAECGDSDVITLKEICEMMKIGMSKMDYSNDLRLIEYPLLR